MLYRRIVDTELLHLDAIPPPEFRVDHSLNPQNGGYSVEDSAFFRI